MKHIFYLLILINISCSGQQKKIYFNDIIVDYLNQKSDSIIYRSTIKDLIKPSLSEINIYIDEENYINNTSISVFSIDGSVGRVYSDNYLPDDYKIIIYKGHKINVFYSYLKKVKNKKFNIVYSDDNDIYSVFEDESEEWLIINCSGRINVIKDPTFYTDKKDIVHVKEVDAYQCK